MAKLPKDIKLTRHAQQRLKERQNSDIYNIKNLMKSSCKWYGKDDLIPDSALYLHCLYVCRKSKQMGYITDGELEVIYNKGTGVAITVMEVKEKFLPITQYIKPEYLKQIEFKKLKKLKKERNEMIETTNNNICPDCGKEVDRLTSQGICAKCRTRKTNAQYRKIKYTPYVELSEKERTRIDNMQKARDSEYYKRIKVQKEKELVDEILIPKMPIIENSNYYEMKATQKSVPVSKYSVSNHNINNILSNQTSFINILKECGCTLSDESLKETLNVLIATEALRDVVITISKNENQDTLLDLEHMMNVVEKKLQHNWEYNGFQEVDDIKFKDFLTWRRVLKGAIFFWKKLYQTGALVQMKNAWDAYTADPNEKQLLSGDRINSIQKRYQITTESISTIFNTKKPFTRIFYAVSKEEAYDKFTKWMAERQLHENKSKTTIVELSNESESEKNE